MLAIHPKCPNAAQLNVTMAVFVPFDRSESIAADDRQDFAGDVAGAVRRGQEHIGRRDFLGLGGPLHRRLGAELANILGLLVGRVERRPDRSRRDRVDADAARQEDCPTARA